MVKGAKRYGACLYFLRDSEPTLRSPVRNPEVELLSALNMKRQSNKVYLICVGFSVRLHTQYRQVGRTFHMPGLISYLAADPSYQPGNLLSKTLWSGNKARL